MVYFLTERDMVTRNYAILLLVWLAHMKALLDLVFPSIVGSGFYTFKVTVTLKHSVLESVKFLSF